MTTGQWGLTFVLYFAVFEYFEKGTVIDIPTDDPLSEEEAWKYFRDLTLGIEYRELGYFWRTENSLKEKPTLLSF